MLNSSIHKGGWSRDLRWMTTVGNRGWGREEVYGRIGTNGDMFKDLKKKQRIEKKRIDFSKVFCC